MEYQRKLSVDELIHSGAMKKCAIFGAGQVGEHLFLALRHKKITVDAWVDSNHKEKGVLYGYKIGNPSILNNNYDCIFIAVESEILKNEIKDTLEKMNIDSERIIWSEDLRRRSNANIILKGFVESPFVRKIICDAIVHHRLRTDVGYKGFVRQLEKIILWDEKLDTISWFTDDQKRIAYFRNAKVACSSLIAATKKWSGNAEADIHKDMEREEIRGELPESETYYKFTFVRNPFSRLYSCYMNKVYNKEKTMFSHYCLGYLGKDEGFKMFVKKVCSIPDEWADRHFSSQYFQVYLDGRCRCDYVGKIENLSTEWSAIKEEYNLMDLPKLNTSNTSKWKDSYDSEMVELVYKRFQKDFECFDYMKEYEELRKYVKEKIRKEEH
ncbi:MAG: sulfotransferase family 2 domain-containing protein [Agathobacter sp.]|nr:sulfotransferase family 2 domain-containing protein [Agathobacter sp.]